MMRWGRVVILFLALGAAVNVGVAWGCALFVPESPYLRVRGKIAGYDHAYEDVWREHLLAGLRVCISADWHDDNKVAGKFTVPPPPSDFRTLVRHRNEAARGERTSDRIWTIFGIKLAGWPRPALYSSVEEGLTNDGQLPVLERAVRCGILLANETSLQSTDWEKCWLLPVGVLWTGFFANTAFYAAALWLLIVGPVALRRALRRHRGRCIACGYDLRGAPHVRCPECGGEAGTGGAA